MQLAKHELNVVKNALLSDIKKCREVGNSYPSETDYWAAEIMRAEILLQRVQTYIDSAIQ